MTATAIAEYLLDPLPAPKRTFDRELPHKLTEDEERIYGKKLARKKTERDEIDEKRKNIAKQLNGQIAEVQSDIDRLAKAVEDGTELRKTECGEFHEGAYKVVRRLDTLEEIDRDPLSWADKQTEIPGLDADSYETPPEYGEDEPESDGEPVVEMLEMANGATVAHMPDAIDDESESPVGDGEVIPLAKAPKKSGSKKAKGGKKGRK